MLRKQSDFLKRGILFFVFLLACISLFSQVRIEGTVVDSNDDSPLPGATVQIKGTSDGTITDFNGYYSLLVPEGYETVIFSFIGFEPQEVKIGENLTINCALVSEITQLNEIVAIGYGAAKKGSITGAIARVGSEKLETRPVTGVDQALAGQMAGVRVRATSGELGAALEISIRGKSSVSAENSPLYVVDGVPTSDISDIVTSDIESINVLKDASTAAIYGSRGTNGVVLITTKGGEVGKTKFTFSGYFGLQSLEKKIKLMNSEEWIDFNKQRIDERWINLGKDRGADYKASDSYEYRLSELGSFNKKYMPDPLWEYGSDSLAFIDWQDELFRTAPIQEYQLSASGGSENIKYHISGTYLNQEGIIVYTDYNKINFRSNLNIKLSKRLTLDLNMSPTRSVIDGGLTSGKDAMVNRALTMAPVADKEVGIETGVKPNNSYLYAGSACSPVAYLREITYRQEDIRMRTNISLNYKIKDGLNAKITGAMDNRSLKLHRYIPTLVEKNNAAVEEGELSTALLKTNRVNKYLFEYTLNYNKKIGKHEFSFLGGGSIESKDSDQSLQKNTQFNNDKLTTFTESSSTVNESSYLLYEDRLLSAFGRLNYNFANRYLLSGSIRNDGSSRFGSDNLWGLFPAFSVGWKVKSEEFMSDFDFISNMKLRFSYGETGNNTIPLYRSYAELASSNYSFGNQIVYGLVNATVENKDLGWEKTQSYNYGIDLGFLENRIFISLDYYKKKTNDMLYEVPVAAVTGFTRGWQNIGAMQNSGYEIELTTHNINSIFKWNTFFNFSHNENKVLALGPDDTPILAGFNNSTEILKIGEPMFSYFMYDAIGVYMDQADIDSSPSMANNIPGDVKYRDVNNDGVITEDDKTIVGNPEPDFFWGVTNSFSYKNFDLSILMQGQIGGEIYGIIGRAFDSPNGESAINRPKHWKDRWKSEEDPGNGKVPRVDGTTSGLYDSRWLYDATYWKVKNVTLTYNIDKNLLKGIDRAQIYISGDNLFMRDHYTIGYSPEADNNEGGDYGGYPNSKVYTIGVKMTF